MVAIVSGNSLGLELTSLGVLGNGGMSGSAAQGNSGEQVYVNAATGNLVVQRLDDGLASHGLDNLVLRTYNSLGLLNDDNADPDNGDNWSIGIYAQQLLLTGTRNTAGSTLTRTGRDGAQSIYTWDATRTCYVTQEGSGAHDTIVYNSTTTQYERTDGSSREVEKYSATGRLASVTDANGNTSSYSYNTAGLLTLVTDRSGGTVVYAYDPNNPTRLTSITASYKNGTDANGNPILVRDSSVSYGYDSLGRLITVTVDLTPDNTTDSNVYTTTYTYVNTTNRIYTLTQSDGSSLKFTYVQVGSQYRVETITDALNNVTSYSYGTSRTTVTDPMGRAWYYDYNADGQLTKVTSPSVGETSTVTLVQSYTYDAAGNVLSITNGDGEKVTMTYDANGNQLSVTNAEGNTVTRTYSATNQLLTETVSTAATPDLVNRGGIAFSGSDIFKQGGTDGSWDSSVRSSGGLAGGASVAFQPLQNDKAFMVGLNTDPGVGHSWGTLDFALYCTADGTLEVRESNSPNKLTTTWTYAPGDDLRVTYDNVNGRVNYLKNGAVIWTTNATVSAALYADSSFCDQGARITNLKFGATATSGNVQLVATNNAMLTSSGTVSKTTGGDGMWDASLWSLTGYTGGAMVSFKPSQTNKSFMVGLNSDRATNDSYSSIDYALYCRSDGTLCAYENGVRVDFVPASPTYSTTDTLRVVYTGSKVQYLKIDSAGVTTVLREVTVSISDALYMDSSFSSTDATLNSLQFGKTGLSTVMAAAREGGTVVSGDSITKRGGTSGSWDSSVHSSVGYVGQANLSFSPGQADKEFMIGLNTDPKSSYSWAKIDYAFYCTASGALQIRENGGSDNLLTTATTYAATDTLQITYDGGYIRYLKNGKELFKTAAVITGPLYIDSSFKDVGAKVTNLRWSDRANPELTTRYVYSATKPTQLRYVVSAEGRITEYVYNAYGERSSKITYPRSIYSLSGLDSDDALSESQLDAWVTSLGSNLSNTVREDYLYDARGMLTYVKQYEGTNADGTGKAAHQTQYVYDPSGRLLKVIQPGGSTGEDPSNPTTSYSYDGLGRVLTVTSPNGAVTSTVYTDSLQKAVVTYQSGATATSTYDKAGRLLSYVRAGLSTTSYVYDAAGRVIMTQRSVGNPTIWLRNFNLYDEAGRQVATVDADGTLTESTYDKAGRITRVYTYATAIDLTLLVDANGVPRNPALADIRPGTTSSDLQRWSVYDDAGQLVYDIAESGAVTQYDYDGAGRRVRTLRYAAGITLNSIQSVDYVKAQLADLEVVAAASNDRSERSFYDGDGLLIGKLDGEGFLTRYTYDKAGRLVYTRGYATAVAEAERNGGGLLDEITPETSVDDKVELYYYDARGLLLATVDGARYVTRNTYDNRGLLATQTRYATPLAAMPWWTDDIDAKITEVRPGGVDALTGDDRRSFSFYRLDGQLLKTTNFEGTNTFYEYDASGRLITTTQSNPTAVQERVTQTRYDAWGRKIAELGGVGSGKITADMSQAQIDAVWASDGVDYVYDALDRLRSRTDANGLKTLYYYDEDNRLAYTVNAAGEVEQNKYNALGQLTSTVRYATRISTSGLNGGPVVAALTSLITLDAVHDSTTSYGYDGVGRQISVTDGEGAVTSTSYNMFDEVRQRLVPWQGSGDQNVDRRVDTSTYDRRGLLLQSIADANGVASTVDTEHDAFGRVTKVTTNGHSRSLQYDRLGRLVTTTNPLNKSVRTTYDAFGQVLSVTDELGKVTSYTYDRDARSVTMTTPEGVTVTTVHTVYGQTYNVKDGKDVNHYFYYDRDGNLTQTQVGSVITEIRDYDAAGRLSTSTDAKGIVTSYTYDAANRVLTRTLDPTDGDLDAELNLTTTWTYDALGQAITVKDPRGTITEYTFDLVGRTTKQVVDPTGLALRTDWTYDAQGHVLTVIDPNRVTTQYVYDELGRRKSETVDPTGLAITRHYDYDKDGNVIAAYDALGNATRYDYDDAGRLRSTIDAQGGLTYNEYTDTGKIKTQTRYADAWTSAPTTRPAPGARDQVTRYVYDDDGRLHYTIDAVGGLTRTRYDANGNVTAVTRYATAWTSASDPTDTSADALAKDEDRTDTYHYDSFNRQIRHADPTGAFTLTSYDSNGNVTRIIRRATLLPDTDAAVATPNSDALDRITDYQYDNANRVTYTVDPMGFVTLNGYDKNGNVTSIVRYVTAVTDRAHPEGVGQDTSVYGDRTQSFTYDRANRLHTSTDAAGGVETFTYDDNGNKKTFTNKNNDVWSYDYDKANRLVKETSPQVALYTMTLNADGTLTPSAGVNAAVITTLGYDNFGNLKTRTEAYGRDEQRTTTYEYDKLNRQIKVTYPKVNVYKSEPTAQLETNGATGDAARSEVIDYVPTTQTWYDAFGNAVSSTDRNGHPSFKAYDAAGRVKYEIDALGYVTRYIRNAFGEATTQRRYATATALADTSPTSAHPAPSVAEIDAVVMAAGFTTTLDRSLSTSYDKAGRVTKVSEPAAYSYNSTTVRYSTYYGKQTTSSYNAFGEVVQIGELVDVDGSTDPDTSTWQYTYQYYDKGGRKIATADAGGYLTTYDYDSEGNLKTQTEFNNQMSSGSWSVAGYAAPSADSAHDRVTTRTWDKLNRKISETKLDATVYAGSTSTYVNTDVVDETTNYGYDAVGNQTWVRDANGGITRTYYDALGRTRAVVAPSRSSTEDASALLPLVEFRRDAHGNVLVKIERANTAENVTETSYSATSNSTLDRTTKTLYDSSGNALQVQDAMGFQHYTSYYGDGKVAKTWQTVKDNDGAKTTLYTAYYYDELGRLKSSYSPGPQVGKSTSTSYSYNGFGELIARGRSGGWQESFEYDNAGRMWRTNAGDGYATVYLYDLLGRQTAEITSAGSGRSGSADVSTAADAATAAAWTSTRRINIKYNALGQVVERQEAERLVIEGGVTIRKASATATLVSSNSITWTDRPNGIPYGSWSESPQNQVNLTWTTLAYLGSGDVRVDLTYKTLDTRYGDYGSAPVTQTESEIFSGYEANIGATLAWSNNVGSQGGISALDRVTVYKRNINGDWIKVIDRDATAGQAFGDYGTQVEIGSPVDPTTAVTFKYRLTGTTAWTTATLSKFGDSHWFDTTGMSGTYEYEVWLTAKDSTAEKTESGTFTTKTDDSDDAATTNNWERPVIQYTRDRWGNALTQSDPRNTTWKTVFTYNRDNQVTTEKRPDPTNGDQTASSPTRNIYYDRLGRQRAVQDERGFVNVTEWDSGGNLIREIHADAGKVTYFYDAFGQRVRMVDALGNTAAQTSSVYTMHTTRYAFDRLGRQTSTTHGNTSFGAVTNWHVDGATLDLIMDGREDVQETFTYDEAGRKLSQSNGAKEKTRYWYDRAGNLVKTQLPGGQSSSATFDDYGHKLSETDANGNTSTWKYSYFGQLQAHTDIGGAVYTYLYDKAGQLTNQTNTRGQNLTYGYDAAGQLLKVTDATLGQTTTNAYDMAGRHVREKVVVNGEMFQDNHLSYDILGRLIDSADDRAHLTFQYDAAGNRTRITTHVRVATVSDDDAETVQDETRYFIYDKMNRQLVVDGIDATGNISANQGHILTYDVNGNRLTDTFWGNKVTSTTPIYYTWDEDGNRYTYTGNPVYTKSSGYVTETYSYDGYSRLSSTDRDGTIVDQRWYDKAGRVVQSGVYNLPTGYTDKLNEGVADADQIGMELRRQIYDLSGRMAFQRAFRSDGTIKYDIAYQGVDRNGAALGYDDAGNVKAYEFRNAYGGAYQNTTTITLAKFEGYSEQITVTTSTKFKQGQVTSTYDANGFLVNVDDDTENSLDKAITNDAAGRVLRVVQDGHKLYNSLVNGEVLGKFGVGPNEIDPRTSKNKANFQQVAEFGFGYRSITGSYPAPSVGSYTVRQGDTLQGIAQAAWGDSGQWWRIAQANGLQGDRDLRVGQTLTLPSAVSGTTNNSSTFKPYNPSDVIGDTSPNLPQPKNKGCGAVGMIIMIVVAVVVTIYTAGALSTVAGATLSETMAAGAATLSGAGTVAGASVAGSMGLGMTGTAMAVGAISAAAGSLASQLVGVAMGDTKFSWKQVAQSSASGALSAGIGAEFGAASMAGSGMQNTIVRAAVSNAMTQSVSVAAGWQKSFSWTGVAASAAGTMMSQGVSAASNEALSQAGFGAGTQKLVTGTLAGIAGAATVATMRGGRVSMQQIAADAFGNALGSSLVDGVQPEPATKTFNADGMELQPWNAEPIEVLQPVSVDEVDPVPGIDDSDGWRPTGGMRNVAFRDGPMGPATDADGFRQSLARVMANKRALANGAGMTVYGNRPVDETKTYLTISDQPTIRSDGASSANSIKVLSASSVPALEISSAQPLEMLSTISSVNVAEIASLDLVNSATSTAPVWNMRDASAAAMREQTSTGDFYGSLAEGASNAQYVSAMLNDGLEAGGKAAGAAKLLPAGALQQTRVEALMKAKNLEAAQDLIKGPTAKSALAMAEYGTKYAGTFKAIPYLGATLSVAEEANRVYRADGWEETTKVVVVGTGNWWFDGMATTGGAWGGAKGGAAAGAVVGSFVPVLGTGVGAVVGGIAGAVIGGLFGHWTYDTWVAPTARAVLIGEEFRDGEGLFREGP